MRAALATRPGLAPDTLGLLYGFVAVLIFSMTMPLTRLAVAELDPAFVALGRALVAALLSAVWLLIVRAPLPPRNTWRPLALIAGGCVIGFPWLTSIAMHSLPASHGAILIGVLPLATAVLVTLSGRERPGRRFWIFALLGSLLVVGFALFQGGGSLHAADLLLLGGVLLAATGYAEGGRLSSTMGGEQVICWALVLSAPFALTALLWQLGPAWQPHASAAAWASFAYVSVFSMFLGFFFWYRGMALGGVARVGQVQLLQPFFSLLGAAVLLGERLQPVHALFALGVIATVAAGRRAQVRRPGVK
ncbi:DMT family transporter [Massilia sp. TS11]|uniref:DMT family transporter n=1 Tax=Massilia sp. TS11 TaxID=2908003 RepID=UPI001EDBB1D0|nr:DMT family transporter [Massilia sp. TS11]MCG2583309.1 DMT family transporter [Massilia sp. TS11]